MAKSLTIECPSCNMMHFQVAECKDLVIQCPSCGPTFKVTATSDDAVIKIRLPKSAKLAKKGKGSAG
jgi:uncharacterized Zn finger protein (UPF0148 family)